MRDTSEQNGITELDELSLMKMRVLQQHTRSICNVIEARDFLPTMISANVFTLEEWQDVKEEKTRHRRAESFTTLLLQKNVEAFDAFVTALYEIPKYSNLLKMINVSLEELRFQYEDERKAAHRIIPCNPPSEQQNVPTQPPAHPVAPPNIPTFIMEDSALDSQSSV